MNQQDQFGKYYSTYRIIRPLFFQISLALDHLLTQWLCHAITQEHNGPITQEPNHPMIEDQILDQDPGELDRKTMIKGEEIHLNEEQPNLFDIL